MEKLTRSRVFADVQAAHDGYQPVRWQPQRQVATSRILVRLNSRDSNEQLYPSSLAMSLMACIVSGAIAPSQISSQMTVSEQPSRWLA